MAFRAQGDIADFRASVVRDVLALRVFRFFGEALRQSGILIVGSTGVIWGLVFISGLGLCGVQAAYFTEAAGAPAYGGGVRGGRGRARRCRWCSGT